MCEGTREDGSAIAPNDPFWDDLNAAARAAKERPRAWLEQSHIYGDLAEAPRFADAFERWLALIWSQGCVAALRAYVES
jgi:mannitol 2-dehydrogenase